MAAKLTWSGVYPAATTQFTSKLALDLPATQKVQGALIDDGVDGLIIAGTVELSKRSTLLAAMLISLPLSSISPVAEAAPAVGSGMPARRTIIERATTAIGAAMPAVSAAAVNLNHLRVLVLLQRRARHSPSRGDSSQGGACKKGNGHKIRHEHPPVSRLVF